MSENENIYEKLNNKIVNEKKEYNTVLDEDKFIVIKTIGNYCRGISDITGIPIEYFINKIELIDIIRFSESDETLEKLSIKESSCRSYNFFKNNKYGIVVKADTTSDKEYTLMHELTHFFINVEEKGNMLELRNNLPENSNKRLDEGITEKITQDIWDDIYPEEISIGFRENRYLMEIQVAEILIDTMGKNEFIEQIIKNPKIIIKKLKEINYKNTSFFDYVEKEMQPLVKYRGRNEQKLDFDILNIFEALSDCHDELKLEKKNDEVIK